MVRQLALAAAAALFAAMQSPAAEIAFPRPSDPVPGAAGARWLDLVRQVLPDYTGEAGTAVIPLRHIDGASLDVPPPEAYGFAMLSAVQVLHAGRPGHVALIDLGQWSDSAEGYAALAMFDAGAAPALADAALVSFDRLVFFADPPTVRLSPGDDLVVVTSGHINAGQGYGSHAMVLPRDGRLELAGFFNTFSESACGYEWTQTPSWRPGDRGDRRYADIVVTVTEVVRHDGAACGGPARPGERRDAIVVTWRWNEDEQRFVPDSDALEQLAARNEQRF